MISLDLSEACGKKNATNAGLHPAPAANHNRNITSVMAKITTTRAGKEGKDIKVKIEDLRGLRFGRLVCTNYFYKEKPDRGWHWRFACDCGINSLASSRNIQSGHTESCGCFMRDQLAIATSSHGRSDHSAYISWGAMMSRCYDLKHKAYHRYGGRGIRVCERWRTPELFCVGIGEKPHADMSLERVNNEGNYSCGECGECVKNAWVRNVVWATRFEQSRNKSNSRIIEIDGARMIPADWAKRVGISSITICSRLRIGWSGRDAVLTPVRKRSVPC